MDAFEGRSIFNEKNVRKCIFFFMEFEEEHF